MAHLDVIGRKAPRRSTPAPRSGITGAAAILLLGAVAIAAVGEVMAARAARTAPAPRPSSWQTILQLGEHAHARGDHAAARRAYLMALFRARGEASVAGVLGAAEAFERLGDRAVVEQAARIAAGLATQGRAEDADTARRLQALHERLQAADALPVALHPLR
jgi:hypothetical protein